MHITDAALHYWLNTKQMLQSYEKRSTLCRKVKERADQNFFLVQGCTYETEPSIGGRYNITKIANDPYSSGNHCWAEYKCPAGYEVQYNFDYFYIEPSSYCGNDHSDGVEKHPII